MLQNMAPREVHIQPGPGSTVFLQKDEKPAKRVLLMKLAPTLDELKWNNRCYIWRAREKVDSFEITDDQIGKIKARADLMQTRFPATKKEILELMPHTEPFFVPLHTFDSANLRSQKIWPMEKILKKFADIKEKRRMEIISVLNAAISGRYPEMPEILDAFLERSLVVELGVNHLTLEGLTAAIWDLLIRLDEQSQMFYILQAAANNPSLLCDYYIILSNKWARVKAGQPKQNFVSEELKV
jgi:hypothetical protein